MIKNNRLLFSAAFGLLLLFAGSVSAATPMISIIDPTSITFGAAPATGVSIGGGNFEANATVRFMNIITAAATAFTPSGSTSTMITVPAASLNVLPTGTYYVTVINPSGGSVTSSIFFTVNPAPAVGTITLVKRTVGGGSGNFTFTNNFSKAIPQLSPNSVNGFQDQTTLSTIPAGTGYYITETAVQDFTLTSATCVDVATNSAVGLKSGSSITGIILTSGQTLTCTFTNTYTPPAPKLKLVKTVNNTAGGNMTASNWTLSATGTGGFSDLGNSSTFHSVNAGTTYALSESPAIANYSASAWSCTGGSLVGSNLTLSAGQNVTCTITNSFGKNSPTISATLSSSQIAIGGSAFLSSILGSSSGNASGTVTYTYYTNSACSVGATAVGTKPVTNSIVPDSTPMTFITAGTYYWRAVYSGDANNNAATSPCVPLTVAALQAPVISTFTATAATISAGQWSTLSWTLSGGAATSLTLNNSIGSVLGSSSYYVSPSTTTTYLLTATNAAGTTSKSVTVTVTSSAPAPVITYLSQSTATVGSAAFTLAVNGSNFVNGAVIKINAAASTNPTAFVNSTQLTTTYNPTTQGTFNITVTNPDGQTSNITPLTVTSANNPVPTISGLSPTTMVVSQAPAGGLIITGTNFIASSVVNVVSIPSPTIYFTTPPTVINSSTQMNVIATQLNTLPVGNYWVSVVNPAPGGGGTTYGQMFIVTPASTPPTLTVNKVVSGGIATASSFAPYKVGVTTITLGMPTTFAAGTYTITETATANYTASYSSSCAGGSVTLANNQNVTCTITNTYNAPATGKIVVTKKTTGGDGVFSFTGTAGNFQITTSLGQGTATLANLTPGTYSISESSTPNWTQDTNTCASVTVTSGQTATCTIANTYAPPTQAGIKIIKKTPGVTTPATFTYNIFPTPTVLAITTANGLGSDFVATGAGNFTITEVIADGWKFNSVSCDQPTSTITDNISTVTLGTKVLANQVTTCTFTNSQLGELVVKKVTSGGDGTFNFQAVSIPQAPTIALITTTAGTGSKSLSLAPGTYLISEDISDNWLQTAATCDNGTPQSAIILPGQTTTCTFTNKINSVVKTGTIKIVANTNSGNGTFNFTSNFGVSSITTTNGTGSQTVGDLNSASYFISEIVPPGWVLSSSSCDHGSPSAIFVTPGQTTTCTFNNYKTTSVGGPTITSLIPNPKTQCTANTLTINGTGFLPTSKVYFGSVEMPATYVSSIRLTADISQTPVGDYSVTVTNPAPAAGTSNAVVFSVQSIGPDTAPTISSISPSSANQGDAALTLSINGTNFTADSIAKVNGTTRPTTFVSATRLTIELDKTDLANKTTFSITVTNPSSQLCGPQVSNTARFAVNDTNSINNKGNVPFALPPEPAPR